MEGIRHQHYKGNIRNTPAVEIMPMKDRVISRASEMIRHASETQALQKEC
jgi:hypothetical protein